MKLTKKKYERPHMEVFELKQQPQLLAGSSGDIPNSDPYTPDPNPDPSISNSHSVEPIKMKRQ